MKNFIKMAVMSAILTVLGTIGVSAQKVESPDQFFVGYSFLRQNVKFVRPSFNFDENTDSHGLNLGYTRYVGGTDKKNGVVGFTADFGGNFDNKEASLVTLMGGVTAKARNSKYVQPYVRGLAGVGRQHVNRRNILDTTDVSLAYALGAGLDFKLKADSKYALSFGVDYVNTNFNSTRQHGTRFVMGVSF